MTDRSDQIKALASEIRMEILRALDEPERHFSHQQSADPVDTGVCMQLIAEHFEVSQPTISRHLELLKRARFINTQRLNKWTYCTRNEAALSEYADFMKQSLNIQSSKNPPLS